MRIAVLALATTIASSPVFAECVAVKYRSTCVDLGKLECTETLSSFVHEVCYDAKNEYMVILLNTTRYHYCQIPKEVVGALIHAESVGRFYDTSIKGKFGCQGLAVPAY
jgi:hypothetical protein